MLLKFRQLIHQLPNTDDGVSITGVQEAAVSGPSKGSARRLSLAVGRSSGELGEIVDHGLRVKIEDTDTVISTDSQPILVRGELQSIDGGHSVQGEHVRTLSQVPHHDVTVLATRSAHDTVGGDSKSVDVTGVAVEIVLELEVLEIPNLNE